jgi:ATP-dependent DNA helicase RecG
MADLAALLGITEKGVEWQVRRLRTAGLLTRVGPARGGHWEVVG